MNNLTFMSFAKVLFGEDMEHVATQKVDFINSDNVVEKLELQEFFIKLLKDLADAWIHPVTLFFPTVNKSELLNPFKRYAKN
jgi:hypothetical protein